MHVALLLCFVELGAEFPSLIWELFSLSLFMLGQYTQTVRVPLLQMSVDSGASHRRPRPLQPEGPTEGSSRGLEK